MPQKETEQEKERQEIIENKIQKLEKQLQKEKQKRKQLEDKIEQIKPNSNLAKTSQKDQSVSRREFLKKAGTGAAGLAALSLTPATALNIKDSNGLQVYSEGTKNLDLQPNGNLNLQTNSINNVSNITASTIQAQNGLEVPNRTSEPSGDNNIWIQDGKLKVKIAGNIYVGASSIPQSLVARIGDNGTANSNENLGLEFETSQNGLTFKLEYHQIRQQTLMKKW